ncbi:MAG: hypothetical protein KGZ74_15415 [Chitinophagaceae bacterium]|nr:hypothetical protein [Chitinophagaceae bacterium]
MKHIMITAAMFVSLCGVSQTNNKVSKDSIIGTFIIDLRPTPESAPYLKEFTFTKVNGNRFDGEFYGYPFAGGFLNTDWNKIYFAFTTRDQSGIYYHSGSVEGDKVTGITLNEARGFILPWKGDRKIISKGKMDEIR